MKLSKQPNNFDFFDDLFKKLGDDEFISSSVNDFSRLVQDSIQKEVNKKGYTDLSNMIQSEVKAGFNSHTAQTRTNPHVRRSSQKYISRYAYFNDAINDRKFYDYQNTAYEKGQKEAIEYYKNEVARCKENLCMIDKIVGEEIKELKKRNNIGSKYEGYLDGLLFVQKVLIESKAYMMDEVNNSFKRSMSNE